MKQLDAYGDYVVQDEYEDEIQDVDHNDLLDQRPKDSLVWFANYGIEVVGISGSTSQYISPDSVLFELVKALHENKNQIIDEVLIGLNLCTYSVKAVSPNIDGD